MLAQAKIRSVAATAAQASILNRIPDDVRASLSRDQLNRLAAAFAPSAGGHGLALRASFHWITGRYFVALLAGPERRSEQRLRAEGQTIVPVGISVFVFLGLLVCYGVVPLAFILYLVKTALRINVMDGPSPLHGWMCG